MDKKLQASSLYHFVRKKIFLYKMHLKMQQSEARKKYFKENKETSINFALLSVSFQMHYLFSESYELFYFILLCSK